MRGLVALVFVVLGSGCRLVVDSGATFHGCEAVDESEPFALGTTLDELYPKCWQVETKADEDAKVEDGDLILRSRFVEGAGDEWDGGAPGAFVYRTFAHDFLLAVRVEALDSSTADHCLPPGEVVGLAARRGADYGVFMIGPFDPPTLPPDYGCGEEALEQPPAFGVARTNAWGPEHTDRGADDAGIGADTEADIAMCRSGSTLTFYYRDPKSPETAPVWLPFGADLKWQIGEGPVDVGPSVAGVAQPSPDEGFQIAGHFQWAWLTEELGPDFCQSALERVVLPGVE